MPLVPGQRIGAYEIVSQIGAGGMGEVYRARDSKLKREVAIKVLPADVASDRERLARFQREAEVLASLNHPHIAHVYGFEDGPTEAGPHKGSILVMELVEGEDLSQRIARGPIPIDEALPIAKQIAEALEAAHEAGIVHRDLKPANVKVRDDGTVKVLDFGLAKALDPGAGNREPGASALANSPTITSPAMTMRGVILGTAAYMSPEQAKGKAVDRRADIWAFGAMLYEMLTGARAFKGDDVTDIITAVMRDTPDWGALPAQTPASIHVLLRRCLEKDPRKRAAHVSIARHAIEDVTVDTTSQSGLAPAAPRRGAWPLALGVGVAMAVAASAITLLLTRRDSATIVSPPVLRYSLPLPTRSPIGTAALAPDGRMVAIAGRDDYGNRRIWLRALDGDEYTVFAAASDADFPFWSPDGREIAFFADKKLLRASTGGGAPQQIADASEMFARSTQNGSFATWGDDGAILFGAPDGIYRVAAGGGSIERVTPSEPPAGVATWQNFHWPQWLPGQRGLLYATRSSTAAFGISSTGALVHQLLDGAAVQWHGARARAQVTSHGVLIGREDGDLRLHQFDAATGKLESPGVLLAGDASLLFSASDSGMLVYRRGSPGAPFQLAWVDQSGQTTGEAFDVAGSGPFSLSRDGSLLAYGEGGTIKVRDLARGVSAPLVKDGVEVVFSPDGRRVAYAVLTTGRPRVVTQSASGGAVEVVYESDVSALPEDWSSDGKYLAVNAGGRRGLIVPLDRQQPPSVYADVPGGPGLDESRFSPDGRWLLYNALENGRHEVFVVPLPATGERWQVSSSGGSQGRWRRDGKMLFYLANDGALMAVDVDLVGGTRPTLGRPRQLFATGLMPVANIDQYAPNAEGTKFLLRRPRGEDVIDRLEVIANWPALVRKTP